MDVDVPGVQPASYGAYCSEITRVRPEDLYRIDEPSRTALLFLWGRGLPWRAYLARYPEVSVVIVIGDDGDKKMMQPKPSDIAEVPGMALRQRGTIDCYRSGALTMCVYERV